MSHFSTVKTELRQLGPLMTALQDLGYSPEQGERQVRGYRGQTVQADICRGSRWRRYWLSMEC